MKISKSNLYKYIYALLFLPLLARFFTDNFGLSYAIMPVFDIYAIVIILISFYLSKKRNHCIVLWLFIFIFSAMISLVINCGTTPSNLFYSARPYFRMIIAIMLSTLAFDIKSFEKLFKYIQTLLYINAIIMTYQFIFQGLRQDIIGGTFGNNQGVNAIQNLFCVFVFCVTVEYYLRTFISKRILVMNIIVIFYIAILAEINIIFFEAILIGGILFLLNRSRSLYFSKRKLFLILGGLCGAAIAVYLFVKFNTDRLFLLSFSNILEYLGFNEGNTGVYRISRVKVFSQLGNMFFKNDLLGWLFGYGLGNCSTHSTFYYIYQNLQYTFFSSSSVFLETGLFGVFANIGVIITTFILSIKNRKIISDIKLKAWMDISVVMSFIMILLFFYNSTLRDIYTAFFAGVLLGIPYVIKVKKGDLKKYGEKII